MQRFRKSGRCKKAVSIPTRWCISGWVKVGSILDQNSLYQRVEVACHLLISRVDSNSLHPRVGMNPPWPDPTRTRCTNGSVSLMLSCTYRSCCTYWTYLYLSSRPEWLRVTYGRLRPDRFGSTRSSLIYNQSHCNFYKQQQPFIETTRSFLSRGGCWRY